MPGAHSRSFSAAPTNKRGLQGALEREPARTHDSHSRSLRRRPRIKLPPIHVLPRRQPSQIHPFAATLRHHYYVASSRQSPPAPRQAWPLHAPSPPLQICPSSRAYPSSSAPSSPSRSGRRQGYIHPAARWHANHHCPRRHCPGPVWGRQDVHDLPLRLPGYRDQHPRGACISEDMDRGFTDRKNLLMDRNTMAPKINDLRSQLCLQGSSQELLTSFLLEVSTLRSFLVPHVVGGLHF